MTLASKFALLIVSACAVSFLSASSCASTEAKKQQQMAELTPEQIANMSPDEVAEYYARRARLRAEQAQLQAEDQEANSGFTFKVHSVEKRERLGNVNERLLDNADNAVFPWQSHDPHRSESLLGRGSVIYNW
jgi:hypothetical protein